MMEFLPEVIGGLVGGMLGAIIVVVVSSRMHSRDQPAQRSSGATPRRPSFVMPGNGRVASRRAATYEDVAVFSYWASDYVARTKPIVEPAPSSPDPLPDDQIWAIDAAVALHASPVVRELAMAMNERLRAFYAHADILDKAQVTGQDPLEAWRAVTASRDAFLDAADALRSRMAEELRQE